MSKKWISRRSFLKTGSAALAAPYVITSAALGNQEKAAASERVTMGAIGLGGRGTQDMMSLVANDDVQMVAVCDAQRSRRQAGKARVDQKYGNQDCTAYLDVQELLARSDIDAVLVATGDNNHSVVAVMAAKAGKDMYCEKPMSVTVAEGRELCRVMERYGTIFQCGTQRRSVPRFAFAVALAQSGKLGELKTLYAEKSPDWFGGHHLRTLPAQPQPPRDEVDWDAWLGPAPWRPYNADYMKRNFWGGHQDFAGGPITEWGSHTVDLCQWANNCDHTSPIHYELAAGTKPADAAVIAHYENGVRLVFEDGVWPLHVRFEGTEGWVYVDDDGNMEAEPKSLLADHRFGKGYPAENHIRNFLDCLKDRRQPIAPAEGAHRANSTCQIANICVQLGRELTWDPKAERFVEDPMADSKLARAMRPPWCF